VSYEVVAVDNASRDGSADMLAAHPDVRLIRNPRNVGFAAAVNQAYRAANAELILVLNSDVRLRPGALRTMVSFLRDNQHAAGVSPLYLNPDGTFQQHYVQLPGLRAAVALFTGLRRLPQFRTALHRFEMRGEDFSQPRQLASGSCLLLRRTALGANEILDENFPIYWNDAILARQLDRAGHQLWMIPDAVVTHSRNASCRRLGPAMRFRHLLGGLVGYLRVTQPRHRVALFQAILLANHLVKTVFGRPTVLGLADLLAALRGDVGPVPNGDTRDWVLLVGTGRTEIAGEGRRLLFVYPSGSRPRWRFTVRPADDSVWHATLPALLPFGPQWAPVDRINGRIGAALLRHWLDRHAGARVLRLSQRHAYLTGRLGEDVLTTVEPQPLEFSHG
jgi:GT2 family glycosyltransferase